MDKAELIRTLEDIEWDDFEVKEAKSAIPKSSWETVSEFSNTSGGWLIFGVSKKGNEYEIKGVSNPVKYPVKYPENLNKTQLAIVEMITENPKATRTQMAKDLGLTDSAIKKNLCILKSKGILIRVGPAKSGHREVVE